jgi:hypothetical protein
MYMYFSSSSFIEPRSVGHHQQTRAKNIFSEFRYTNYLQYCNYKPTKSDQNRGGGRAARLKAANVTAARPGTATGRAVGVIVETLVFG